MANYETLTIERRGRVAIMTINRPDKLNAFEADHVLVCGRVKPHTGFVGPIESGLHKMMLIGLGKRFSFFWRRVARSLIEVYVKLDGQPLFH